MEARKSAERSHHRTPTQQRQAAACMMPAWNKVPPPLRLSQLEATCHQKHAGLTGISDWLLVGIGLCALLLLQ